MKKLILGFILLSSISFITYSCGEDCDNCGGDGWVEAGNAKYPCPKCDNTRK